MKLLSNTKASLITKTVFFIGSVLLSTVSLAQQLELQVKGIQNTQLNNNVRIYVGMIDKEEADGSERHKQLVREAIDKALRAYGYYQSEVEFQIESQKPPKKDQLIAHVKIGEPVKIADVDFVLQGEATQDPEFIAVTKNIPEKGSILNHETYDNYKSHIQKVALSRGYFDGDFLVSRLEVRPSTQQAWWRLNYDSGERYRFGEVTFENAQIREDYLRNMINFNKGQPYLINDLSTLTNNYTSSNWFSSVLMQPVLDEEHKIVNVDVLLQPRKKNSMEVGIGWASDVGPRLQLGWTKPWINNRGHSFRTNLYVSAPKQTLEATYKMPLLKNPLNYYYEYSAGLENENKNDTESFASSLSAIRYWNHEAGWQHSLGLRVRYDSFIQANVKDKTLLVFPTASVRRTRLQGGLFPTWGDTQKLTVDLGRTWWLSDVDFLKMQGSSLWVRTYLQHHRIVTRLELGWLHTKNIERIPPALRFFAGGDRSIRGYGYKKIAPKNNAGKLVGGSRLLTGSFEYQYQVYPDWWLATFADTGLAANQFTTKELRYGAGMGVRWASPVGAIKFDIATPVRDKDNSKNIQFYIGLGAEL
ncbi:TPA: autotransporter assembly complex family protein [Pasteurella multocida]|uniref:autotransporter assembly complex protein TamA n=1 Tax=Pasteurella multocida TaxID=747 RepID=UPI002024C465|nr:autotransporter assembly complex family protein [Pasteurella multocida]MDT8767162.1 autotransporter assembly complex protein TamA [Pasteurella multocida]URJ86526.1 autotransporter assembly complex protein TamA [Pasteurella multocida]URJ88509.1 autotransporter assembly complex protein TamA [Pasteurella multocida]HDR0620098.1 outer membrane protein assembly factor [Pasteurella multocida]HDR1228507.1 outer membrane protein assembly factor [Pasteurella multocida]